MTDDISARAHLPGDEPEPEGFAARPTLSGGPVPSTAGSETVAPAAAASRAGQGAAPAVAISGTAVLDSQPLLGFPGESSSPRLRLAAEASRSPEPPPFGFNAPELEPARAVDPPARAWSPASLPPSPRPTVPPRELMPTSIPVYRPRMGEGPTPTFGPPGRHRSVAAMVLFSVLTLGLYAVVWHRRVNREMGDFDPRVHVVPGRSAWAVALPLLAGLLASGAAAARILLDHFGVSVNVPVTAAQAMYGLAALAAVPYLILVLPFSVVAVAMTAERVRVVEEHAGVTADEQMRPAGLVGWLAVPVLGGFVVMGRQQRSLNRIWDLARE